MRRSAERRHGSAAAGARPWHYGVGRLRKWLMLKALQQSPKKCAFSLTIIAYVLNLLKHGKVQLAGWQGDEGGIPALPEFRFSGEGGGQAIGHEH